MADSEQRIADGTIIHTPSNIWGNVCIGRDCKIAAFVEIGDGVTIGDECKIEAFAFIPPGITIGNRVFIGPHVCFTNDKYPGIGKDWHMPITIVEDYVSIGANATILPGVRLGFGCTVGAGSVVVEDVHQMTTVKGNPAR